MRIIGKKYNGMMCIFLYGFLYHISYHYDYYVDIFQEGNICDFISVYIIQIVIKIRSLPGGVYRLLTSFQCNFIIKLDQVHCR